jgi:hypothetical protein
MRLIDLGPLPLTLIASLGVAVMVLAVRVLVLQRIFSKRQRENRQESERLKSLVAAYRSLAGSFSPALEEHNVQIEATLADIVLFGSLKQVELAAACADRLIHGEPVSYQPLIEELRADLRVQLGLEAIPATLVLPASGPRRPQRQNRGGGGDGRSAAGSVVIGETD